MPGSGTCIVYLHTRMHAFGCTALLSVFYVLAEVQSRRFWYDVILLFQSLLHDPNPNSPANNEAAQLYRENRREYEKKVAAVVQASWQDDEDDDLEETEEKQQ